MKGKLPKDQLVVAILTVLPLLVLLLMALLCSIADRLG